LRATLSNLREQHVDLQEAYSTLLRSTSQTNTAQASQIDALTRQLSVQTSSLEASEKLADERNATITSLRDQVDELNSKQSGVVTHEDESSRVIRDELHHQTSYMHQLGLTNASLTTELKFLRDQRVSIDVLKEENRALKKKVKTLEEARDMLLRAEAAGGWARQKGNSDLCVFSPQIWISSNHDPLV
jgi:mitotic spindle assembly checkpoint protein MAD1